MRTGSALGILLVLILLGVALLVITQLPDYTPWSPFNTMPEGLSTLVDTLGKHAELEFSLEPSTSVEPGTLIILVAEHLNQRDVQALHHLLASPPRGSLITLLVCEDSVEAVNTLFERVGLKVTILRQPVVDPYFNLGDSTVPLVRIRLRVGMPELLLPAPNLLYVISSDPRCRPIGHLSATAHLLNGSPAAGLAVVYMCHVGEAWLIVLPSCQLVQNRYATSLDVEKFFEKLLNMTVSNRAHLVCMCSAARLSLLTRLKLMLGKVLQTCSPVAASVLIPLAVLLVVYVGLAYVRRESRG